MAPNTLPPSVNYHLLQPCNMRCRHCFATFPDVDGRLSREQSVALVQRLAEAGVEKLTFAGGEPMLCPWLPDLVRAAKQAGMTTMMVTNGSRLDAAPWVFARERLLDWVALSVDSASEETHRAMGRAERDIAIPAEQYVRLAAQLRGAGIRVKVNTVVTALNADEDMTAFVRDLAPERWKVLRVLPVGGQNDGKVEPLLVTASQFGAFLSRHRGLATDGIEIVGEDHEDIVGGYAMIDPLGRFFDDTKGHHTYSRPILDVGVHEAFTEVTFSTPRFVGRGGVYQWTGVRPRRPRARLVALVGVSGSGKDTVAAHLGTRGFTRVAVADPIKRAMQKVFELTDEQLWGSGRDVVEPRLGCTPREAYQRFGDACRAIEADVWLRPWRRELEQRITQDERVVCSDVRTHAELGTIRELGGVVLRLTREGAGAPGDAGRHPTETELADVELANVDAVISNDGDVASLFARVDAWVDRK